MVTDCLTSKEPSVPGYFCSSIIERSTWCLVLLGMLYDYYLAAPVDKTDGSSGHMAHLQQKVWTSESIKELYIPDLGGAKRLKPVTPTLGCG